MYVFGNLLIAQVYSAQVIVELFKEAGVPDGVINVVYGDPVMISDTILGHKDFSGLHFTGSTNIFKLLWKQIGENINNLQNISAYCWRDWW